MKIRTFQLALGAVAAMLLTGASSLAQIDLDPAVHYTVGQSPKGMTAGDFNGDGFVDLMASGDYGREIVLLRNTQTKGYEYEGAIRMRKGELAGQILAFTSDTSSMTDLAVVVPNANKVLIYSVHRASKFMLVGEYTVGLDPSGIAAGDIDKDGDTDLVIANRGSNSLSVLTNVDGTNWVLDKSFIATGKAPHHVVVADFDNNGMTDMAVDNQGDNTVSLFIGEGDMNFAPITKLYVDGVPDAMVAEDVNGDGYLDLLVAATNRLAWMEPPTWLDVWGGDLDWVTATDLPQTIDGRVMVYLNQQGEFSEPPTVIPAFATDTCGLACVDLNLDGYPDLVTGNMDSNTMTVMLNAGNGDFKPAMLLKEGLGPEDLLSTDVDNDGDLDIVAMNAKGFTLSVIVNKVLMPK